MRAMHGRLPSAPLTRRFDTPAVVWLGCLAVLLVSLPWQMRWGIVADTSYLLTLAEKVLASERLYVDLIDTNPPFSTWLYMPPVILAQMTGMSAELMTGLYTWAACLAGLGGAAAVLQMSRLPEARALMPFAPLFLALLLIMPAHAFSEREHIGLALFLPLVVLSAWPAGAEPRRSPPLWLAIAVGLAGGVIVLVKPYYVLMVVALALRVAWRRRDPLQLLAPEYLAAATLSIAYLGAVFVVYPEFVTRAYPLLADTYMRVGGPIQLLAAFACLLGVWLAIWALLSSRAPRSELAQALFVAALVAWVPYFYQAKGWPYHAYPALALGIAALLCRLATAPDLPLARKILVTAFALIAALPFTTSQRPAPELVERIRAAYPAPTMDMIGSDIAIGHPLVRLVGGHWVSAYCSDWLGASAAWLAQKEALSGNGDEARRYEAMAAGYVANKLTTLTASPPDILLVQSSDLFWLDRMTADPGYARLLAGYVLLGQDKSITAYRRNASPAAK